MTITSAAAGRFDFRESVPFGCYAVMQSRRQVPMQSDAFPEAELGLRSNTRGKGTYNPFPVGAMTLFRRHVRSNHDHRGTSDAVRISISSCCPSRVDANEPKRFSR